jgi:hypothetical protein
VRGTFMQGAPIAEDVAAGQDGDWPFPLMPGTGVDTEMSDEVTLFELPPSTPGGPYPEAVPPSPEDELRLAPREFARMVQTAVQGHGQPLGVAEEIGRIVMDAQASSSQTVQTLLDHLRKGLLSPTATEGSASHPSALTVACRLMDLACVRAAASPHGLGTAWVTGPQAPRLLRSLAARCAERGFAGALLWYDPLNHQGGLELAGPTSEGLWQARWALKGPPVVFETLVDAIPDDPAHAEASQAQRALQQWGLTWAENPDQAVVQARSPAPQSHPCSQPWVLLLCMRPRGPSQEPAWWAGLRSQGGTVLGPTGLREREHQDARKGLPLTRSAFDALNEAGRSLLLPAAEEYRVLAPGVDPMKVF